MEKPMDARLMLIAASALGFAAVAAAEPPKAAAPEPSGTKERPVVLAAAEIPAASAVAGAEATAPPAAPARKPRTARVTTCRCADTPNQ
jgi:hypothetical protein